MKANNDEEKYFQKQIIYRYFFIFLLTIIISLFIQTYSEKADLNYEKIEVIVSSIDKEYPKHLGDNVKYVVMVLYNGEKKKLENVSNGYSYHHGKVIEVYESDGILYEDIEGIKSATNEASAYFISLILVGVSLFLLLYKIVEYKRR